MQKVLTYKQSVVENHSENFQQNSPFSPSAWKFHGNQKETLRIHGIPWLSMYISNLSQGVVSQSSWAISQWSSTRRIPRHQIRTFGRDCSRPSDELTMRLQKCLHFHLSRISSIAVLMSAFFFSRSSFTLSIHVFLFLPLILTPSM